MRISDMITERIMRLIDESGVNTAEIQRNELAQMLGCVPSQINYVLSSRFTPEQGYIIESRRGGGGYIRVTRICADRSPSLMHIVNSVGDSLDELTARVVLDNCEHGGFLEAKAAEVVRAAIGYPVMHSVPAELRDGLRAALVKQMLLALI